MRTLEEEYEEETGLKARLDFHSGDKYTDEFVEWLKDRVNKYKTILDRIPESDEVIRQAKQMDEKEFDEWFWESIYKT